MRRSVSSAAVLTLLLLATWALPGHAVAFEMENWTETWITLEEGPGETTVANLMFMSGSDEYDLFDLEPSAVVEEGVFEEEAGFFVDVTIPNFVDPLERKEIFVLFEGANLEPSAFPSVLEITGFDTAFGDPQAEELAVPGIFLQSFGLPVGDVFRQKEFWEIRPNPDWEIIRVFIPHEFELLSFHITTESLGVVPEPRALLLVGSGLLGLLVAGRRAA